MPLFFFLYQMQLLPCWMCASEWTLKADGWKSNMEIASLSAYRLLLTWLGQCPQLRAAIHRTMKSPKWTQWQNLSTDSQEDRRLDVYPIVDCQWSCIQASLWKSDVVKLDIFTWGWNFERIRNWWTLKVAKSEKWFKSRTCRLERRTMAEEETAPLLDLGNQHEVMLTLLKRW